MFESINKTNLKKNLFNGNIKIISNNSLNLRKKYKREIKINLLK